MKGKFNDALAIFEKQQELLAAVYDPNSRDIQYNNDILITLKEMLGIEGCGQTADPAAELVVTRQKFKKKPRVCQH